MSIMFTRPTAWQSFALVFATLLAGASRAPAQEADAQDPQSPARQADTPPAPKIETVEMTIYPAALPQPVLKYRFLPGYADRTSGNAASVYAKAFLVMESMKLNEKIYQWIDLPLDKLPVKEVRKMLESYKYVLELAEFAASRERCDWDPPVRESSNVFETLLPEASASRRLTRLLVLRARLEMAEGKIGQAQKTISTIYALARDVSQQPFLISGLVGIAIESMASAQVEELIQAADAPNYYWALTYLPSPLVDLRNGLEVEYAALFLVFPELKNLDGADYADEQWDRLLGQLMQRIEETAPLLLGEEEQQILAVAKQGKMIEEFYPGARERLIERGVDRQAVDAMPKSRVVLVDFADSFVEARDEMFKAFYLPYHQAAKSFDEAQKAGERAKQRGPGGLLASLLLPAVSAANLAGARGQRGIETLRTIEAIRLHAAEHQALPKTLADIKAVPVPDDPVTGKPFGYKLENGVATLEVEGPVRPRRLRIRLAK